MNPTSVSTLTTRAWRHWPYSSYQAYQGYQKDRARRTRGITERYARHRAKLAGLLRTYCPDVRTLLCLGARHQAEVRDFRRAGYQAEGIDLIEDDLIHACDMADLSSSGQFGARSFDAFASVLALEHCLDVDGFRRRTLPYCRQAIVAAVPLHETPQPTPWDCTAFDFQRPTAPPEAFEAVFDGFRLMHHEIADKIIYFLMRRDDSIEAPERHGTSGRRSSAMKNLIVANYRGGSAYSRSSLETLLKAQIENSLEVGWSPGDIIAVTNFPFCFQGVSAVSVALNRHCLRGSKMFAVERLLQESPPQEILWAHDLDCWQNDWFDPPPFADVGACEYSRPKFNGGSIFWRSTGRDIAAEIVRRLCSDDADREEPTINAVFKDPRFRDRVTVLNPTYNVGCSGFRERFGRSLKPIRASHFHPTNRLAWETHALDRNGIGERSASVRLERLLRRWYPNLPTAVKVGRKSTSPRGDS